MQNEAEMKRGFPDNCPNCGVEFNWSGRTIFFYEIPLRFQCGACIKEFSVWPEAEAVKEAADDAERS